MPTVGRASLKSPVRTRSFCGERGAQAAGSRHPAARASASDSTYCPEIAGSKEGGRMILSSSFDGH